MSISFNFLLYRSPSHSPPLPLSVSVCLCLSFFAPLVSETCNHQLYNTIYIYLSTLPVHIETYCSTQEPPSPKHIAYFPYFHIIITLPPIYLRTIYSFFLNLGFSLIYVFCLTYAFPNFDHDAFTEASIPQR